MKSEIFSRVAIEAGVNDLETVSRVYHGLLRYIRRELGEGRQVNLDELGKFEPRTRAGCRIFNVKLQKHTMSSDTVQVKFTPCNNLKKYVQAKNEYRKDFLTYNK